LLSSPELTVVSRIKTGCTNNESNYETFSGPETGFEFTFPAPGT